MINTILMDTAGTTLGTAQFPAVPLQSQVVVFNNGRYVVTRVQWHAGQDTKMVLVLTNVA